MKYFGTLLFFFLLGLFVQAQPLPHHDVILFNLQRPVGLGNWKAYAPRFLSNFNSKGYNNQPAFISDRELYLTVQRHPDTSQTDIYALDILLQRFTQVVRTPNLMEFSPTLMPNGTSFSAVRVEIDGSQRLWEFPLDRSGAGRPVFPRLNNIGYHCWLSDTLVALFQVGEPHLLTVAGTSGYRSLRVASNIGRCLQRTPDNLLAFIQKATEQTWFIKKYDPYLKQSVIVTKTLAKSEDFVILPDGTYLAGNGSKLYQFKPGNNIDWVEIADFSEYGVKNITRLAQYDGKKLAVVVE